MNPENDDYEYFQKYFLVSLLKLGCVCKTSLSNCIYPFDKGTFISTLIDRKKGLCSRVLIKRDNSTAMVLTADPDKIKELNKYLKS